MAIPTIEDILDEVLRSEGGFVEDPADPGGATNHGISLLYARGVGLDNDSDGDTDRDDILRVTAEQARELYRGDFWTRPGINRLPGEIQPVMVDWAVNSGPPRPIMALQRVINMARIGFELDEDGVIGPKTRRAAQHAQTEMGPYLNNAIVDERLGFYRHLVVGRPAAARFLHGWLARAEHFRKETRIAA
jgi:lysozyme family protein